jgi:hypothetical protein
MPFTPAHPAIILPLLRSRYFSATGLVIGSISPDFEYFFKMSVDDTHSHTLTGLIYFDLPVSLFLALLFHIVVKKNLIGNLPPYFQRRSQGLLEFNFVTYFKGNSWVFLLSALVGASSHLFWDSFTHNNTYFTQILPFYAGTYVPYNGVNYPLFYALQYISTGLGLTAMLIYIIMIKPSPVRLPSSPQVIYWFTLLIILAATVWIRFLVFPADYNEGNLVVSVMSGLVLSLVCCGLINFKDTTRQQGSLNG